MRKISISKINKYLDEHFSFINQIYTRHNAKEDLEEGRLTFKKFISVEETNARIKGGSQLYQLILDATERAAIFEIESNHLTFASPYSIDFYMKNGFKKLSNDIKTIKGMRYYSLELALE